MCDGIYASKMHVNKSSTIMTNMTDTADVDGMMLIRLHDQVR